MKTKEKSHIENMQRLTAEVSAMERRLVELKTEYADRMYSIEINGPNK